MDCTVLYSINHTLFTHIHLPQIPFIQTRTHASDPFLLIPIIPTPSLSPLPVPPSLPCPYLPDDSLAP